MTTPSDLISGPLDEAVKAYFDGLGRDELMVTRCSACGHLQFPPRVVCYRCSASNSHQWIKVSGRAVVWSYVIFHKAYFSAEVREVPYNVAVVQLDEGPKLVTNIVGVPDDQIVIGMPVTAQFIHENDADRVVFHPAARLPTTTTAPPGASTTTTD